MSNWLGKNIKKRDILSRVGDLSQIAGIKEYIFASGRAEGMRGIDVNTGTGLCFTVLPSRGMDIGWAGYRGIPLSFISKAGLSSPAYFEKDGLGFLRNFTCGLMTTCGLTYMGAPCEDEGQELGLHGRISNIPSYDTYAYTEWKGDRLEFRIGGKVRQSAMFGENMVLTREIKAALGESRIVVCDRIENEGFEETPFMLLYHCNFGYPIVDENTRLILNGKSVTARDERAQEGIGDWMRFSKPEAGFTEQLYYHDLLPEADGTVKAALHNPDIGEGISVYIKYNKDEMPYLAEWKQTGMGDYVVGLEPGTWLPEGRAQARRKGQLLTLKPGEEYSITMEIGVEDKSEEKSI